MLVRVKAVGPDQEKDHVRILFKLAAVFQILQPRYKFIAVLYRPGKLA